MSKYSKYDVTELKAPRLSPGKRKVLSIRGIEKGRQAENLTFFSTAWNNPASLDFM